MITTALITIMGAAPVQQPVIINVPPPAVEVYVPRYRNNYYYNYDRNHYHNYDFNYQNYNYKNGFGGFGSEYGSGFGEGFGNR